MNQLPNSVTQERVQAANQRLIDAVAGERLEIALQSVANVLAATIAMAADTVEDADELIDTLVPDIKTVIRDNWAYFTSARAGDA